MCAPATPPRGHAHHTHMGCHGVVQHHHPLIITTHTFTRGNTLVVRHKAQALRHHGSARATPTRCAARPWCTTSRTSARPHTWLQTTQPPCGLGEAALESCHDDAVFEQVSGRARDAFGRLAMWHTPNHNHKHRLCHHTPPPWHTTTPPHTTSCNPLLWHVRHVGHCHDAHHHTLPTTKWCCCCGGHG